MAINTQVDTLLRNIRLEVTINSEAVPDAFGIQATYGFSQVNKQCSIKTRSRPAVAVAGAEIEAWVYINGRHNGLKLFSGEIPKRAWSYAPGGFEIHGQGKLARLRNKWGGAERVYDDDDDAVVIRNLIEAYGIPASDMRIDSSGWTLGTIDSVVLGEDDVAMSLIEEIDRIAGYITYERVNGIYRIRLATSPSVDVSWTYTQGTNIFSAQRIEDTSGIKNKIFVSGLEYEGLSDVEAEYSEPNPYLEEINPTNPFWSDEITSNLIEDPSKATEVAQRYVQDHNRTPNTVQLTVPGNPLIDPGDTVKITHSKLELSNALMLVTDVQHSIEGSKYRTTFTAIGAALAGLKLKPPTAEYALKFLKQTKDTGSGLEDVIFCYADGSKSSDPDGDETLMTYAWTVSGVGGTPVPTSGSGPKFTFTLPTATTSITLTLVVTDSDGLTDTEAKPFTIDKSQMPVEDLYRVENANLHCTIDGGATWRTQAIASGNGTCLMPLAAAWQLVGTSTGHVYATFDRCKTALIDLGQPNGSTAVVAVWIHETKPERAWAACSDGKVYFGQIDTTAHTATWTLKGTLPATAPYEIRESYGTLNELRATSGGNYYISYDGGATWTALKTSAGTATRMAAGFDTNAVAFNGDSNPVQYESGGPPTFPVLSPVVNAIRAISMGLIDKEIYAADNQNPARTFRSDETLTTFTRKTDLGQQCNHMIRSNTAPGEIYAAVGDGSGAGAGVQKTPDYMGTWFYIVRTGSTKVHMVGVGGTHLPETLARVEVFIPTLGLSAGNNGVYHNIPGVGWSSLLNSGLPSVVWYPVKLVANPNNQAELLLFINTDPTYPPQFSVASNLMKCADGTTGCLWRTTDYGATWTEATIDTTGIGITAPRSFGPEWSKSISGQWFIAARKGNLGGTETSVLWRGSGNASGAPYTQTTNPTRISLVADGLQGDIICAEDQITPQFAFSPVTGGIIYPGPNIGMDAFMDKAPDPSPSTYCVDLRAGGSNNPNLYYIKDYRNTAAGGNIVLANGNATYVTVVASGDVLIGGGTNTTLRRSNILKLDNFGYTVGVGASCAETVLTATAVTGNKFIGQVRSGRRLRTAVAARIISTHSGTTGKDCWVSEDGGATWTLLVGPAGAGNLDLAEIIEVIERPVAA